MTKKNPFTLSFGRKSNEYIDRNIDEEKIITVFTEEPITDQIFLLTGIRGCGKTVTMTNISNQIADLDNWIVIKISPVDNIIDALFKNLIYNSKVHQVCLDAKIDISIFGINVSVNSNLPDKNIIQAIDDILKALQKKKYKSISHN